MGEKKDVAEAQDGMAMMLRGACSYTPLAERDPIKLSREIVLKYLSHPTRSGAQPGEQEIMKFMMLCRSRALNPFEGDAYLVGFDGKNGPEFSIVTAIQALYKRAESNPDYDGIESGAIVKSAEGEVVERQGDFIYAGDVLLGSWARVWRKSQSHPTTERLNLANRDKGRSLWVSDKSGMIVKCAEAGALRRAFPNQMAAMYIAGEIVPDGAGEPAKPPALTPGRQSTKPATPAPVADAEPAEPPPAETVDEATGEVTQDAPAQLPAEAKESAHPPSSTAAAGGSFDRNGVLDEIKSILGAWALDDSGRDLEEEWAEMLKEEGRTTLNYFRAEAETLAEILAQTRMIDKGI